MSLDNDAGLYEVDSDDLKPRKRTSTKIVGAIEGSFAPSGASVVLATVELDLLADTWTEIDTEKARRNGINIQNRSKANTEGLDDIYVSGSNTDTSTPIPLGMRVVAGDERQYAIANVALYVKSVDATSITIEALG